MKKIFSVFLLLYVISCARFDESELYLYNLSFKAAAVAPWNTDAYSINFFYDGTYRLNQSDTLLGKGSYSISTSNVITFSGYIEGKVTIMRDGTGQFFNLTLPGETEIQKFYKKK